MSMKISDRQVKPYKKHRVLLDKKFSMVIYLATIVIAVLCRFAQLKTNMDFSTGKYINDNPFLNYTLAVIIIGFALLTVVLVIGESRDKVIKSCILLNPMRIKYDKLCKKVPVVAAAAMLLMAALLMLDSLVNIVSIASNNIELTSDENPVPLFDGISGAQWISYGMMMILMVTFVVTAMNIFKGDGITPGNSFFLAIFPIWKLYHIFMMITEYQLIGPYSERCYMLFTDIFSGLFFLCLVRFFAGFEKKGTRILMILTGYMASIIAAVSVIPRYAMFVTMDYSTREGMISPDIADIGIIFVTVSTLSVFWTAYEYKNMPRLNIAGRRRWANIQVDGAGYNSMKSIDEK